MNVKITLLIVSFLLSFRGIGQEPKYTHKHFVRVKDTAEFKMLNPVNNGFNRTYIATDFQIFDIDDDSTTFITGAETALLCFEGQEIDHKREGVFEVYLIDSADHSKRYRIWEQMYSHDNLNGEWKTYTLHNTLVSSQTFKNDSITGLKRNFWIDGKTIMDETEYLNGINKFIQRTFYENGKLRAEIPYEDGKLNGIGKKYYEDGTLQEVAGFKDGGFNGVQKYFYPNGQVWIEQIYKEGKNWTVVSNYTEKGQKRNAGTLHEGNGTIIYYNENGTIREIKSYVNGNEKK